MTDRQIVEFIRDRFEGSTFTDDPLDRGGATKYGVTQRTLSAYWGRPASARDVEQLTAEQAASVLLEMFLERPGFGAIWSWPLRLAVVDFAIHSGQATAIKALQIAAGVPADGVLGPISLHAIAACDANALLDRVVAARLRWLGRIITSDPTQARFAAGWLSRVGAILDAA